MEKNQRIPTMLTCFFIIIQFQAKVQGSLTFKVLKLQLHCRKGADGTLFNFFISDFCLVSMFLRFFVSSFYRSFVSFLFFLFFCLFVTCCFFLSFLFFLCFSFFLPYFCLSICLYCSSAYLLPSPSNHSLCSFVGCFVNV